MSKRADGGLEREDKLETSQHARDRGHRSCIERYRNFIHAATRGSEVWAKGLFSDVRFELSVFLLLIFILVKLVVEFFFFFFF